MKGMGCVKRFISMLVAVVMTVSCIGFVYADDSEGSAYDFAVVSNSDITLHNTMRIEGDVFINGDVKMDNAGDNLVDGDIICAGEFTLPDFSPINPTGSVTAGADFREINYDLISEICDSKSGDISVFDEVEYVNNYEWLELAAWTDYPNGMTISENTYIENLSMSRPLTIDTTNGDVYIKLGSLYMTNSDDDYNKGVINIVGDNKVYMYIGANSGGMIGYINCEVDYDENGHTYIAQHGDSSKIDIYIDGKGGDIGSTSNIGWSANVFAVNMENVDFSGEICGDIYTDATGRVTVTTAGTTKIIGGIYAGNADELLVQNDVYGNVVSSATKLEITGGCSNIEGVVFVPYADVSILATEFKGIDGQLVSNTLDLNGTGVVKFNKGVTDKFYTDKENGPFLYDETDESIVVEKEKTDVLVIDTIYTASALNDTTKAFSDVWDVSDEGYKENYESIGSTFGSLNRFGTNYKNYISSDVVATVLIPEDGKYTFNYMLREYRDRGFNITFTKVDETEASASITTINNITKVAKMAKNATMNMGVSQSDVTLEAGTYTMTLTAERGTHLCAFKFEKAADDASADVDTDTEEPLPTENVAVDEEPVQTVIPGFNIEELIPNTTDVRPGGAIKLTSDYAYLFGYTDTVCGANNAITREELSALVNRVLLQNDARDGFVKPNRETFDDVAKDWWSHSAIEYMAEIGVYNSNVESAMPWQAASRWEVAKVVAVSLGLEPSDDASNFNFTDKDEYFCQKYYRYIKAMVDYGYYTGHGDGTIRANDSMTRAEFVTMFNRILGRTENNGYTLENLQEAVENPNVFIDDLDDTHWAYLDLLNAAYSFTDGKVDLSKTIDRTSLDYETFYN